MTTNDHERELANRFKRDTASHAMTVLHDDGLYRHLRLANPKSSFYWFEIITWPGSLAIRGDCGGYQFSRITDMFEFFRANGNEHRINPGYWAEKTPDGGRSVQVYSEDKLRSKVTDALDDYETNHPELVHLYLNAKAKYEATPHAARWPSAYKGPKEPVKPKTPVEVRQIVADHDEDGLLAFDEGARQLLGELETAGVVSDTFEWGLTDWDWQYLWCCHAIVSAIAQYDTSAGRSVVTVELSAEAVAA